MMFSSVYDSWEFDCPEPHTKKIIPFRNNDPYSNPMKSGRFGSKRKPKQKMSKHRQRIKKMKGAKL